MRSGPRAHEKKPSTKGVDGRGHVLHPITEQEVLAGARAGFGEAKKKEKKTEKKTTIVNPRNNIFIPTPDG
jgi:hypothetical protein